MKVGNQPISIRVREIGLSSMGNEEVPKDTKYDNAQCINILGFNAFVFSRIVSFCHAHWPLRW